MKLTLPKEFSGFNQNKFIIKQKQKTNFNKTKKVVMLNRKLKRIVFPKFKTIVNCINNKNK